MTRPEGKPPPHREGAPGEKGARSNTDFVADTSMVVDQSPLAQMKRRREAALRLPPLANGMRDPHFDLYPKDGAA